MIDLVEVMKMFNLTEQPYLNLGCVWCRTPPYSIHFYEDGDLYSAVRVSLVGEDGNLVCIMNDVQQFMGMQPAIFTKTLEISPEKFQELYGTE